MRKLIWGMLLLVLLLFSCAAAEIILPEGLASIEDETFSGCARIAEIRIPASVTSIGTSAFDGIDGPLLIRTVPGSAAAAFARENSIDYQADTHYRALLVAQSDYRDGNPDLPGTLNDAVMMSRMLSRYNRTPYAVNTLTNASASDVHARINAFLGSATEDDVSLFYFSGHGSRGALCCVDGSDITASQLRSWLDQVPGRVIVIVDTCYSGSLIGKGTSSAPDSPSSFVSGFISAFSLRSRSLLTTNHYFVMAAAKSTQESAELEEDDGTSYGVFTQCLAKGCGYAFPANAYSAPPADENGDRVVTFEEAFLYASRKTREILEPYFFPQNAQVYPEDCNWFGFLR